jgi:hypothetical protein
MGRLCSRPGCTIQKGPDTAVPVIALEAYMPERT